MPILYSARLKHRRGFVMLCNSHVCVSLGHSSTDTETCAL